MLKLYNTLTGKKEIFRPRSGKKVNLFVCGPTVYDSSHIGHARTYIFFDVIVKYLKQKGYNVFYLQNITDIDDKIIKRAGEKGIPPQKLAEEFEKEYLEDMKDLKVDSVSKYARATDHIKEIISQVRRLSEKDYAYQIEDGIYFDVSKFKNYGKLSGRKLSQAEDAVSRIDEGKNKRNRGDFCLWKVSKPGEPKWENSWGDGRPGWHLEDTAITEKYFGSQYDIHGGARDLIFPHHEAEIAQMEAISGKAPLVKYWLHTGFLTVEGQKMAKSLGNFITIRDFLKKNSTRLLRLFVIKALYRSPVDYSEKLLFQTKKELERIDEFVDKISQNGSVKKSRGRGKIHHMVVSEIEKKFEKAMEDDFNTPEALAAVFELVNKGNTLISQNKLSPNDAKEILTFLKKVDEIFNFIFEEKPKEKIPQTIINLVKEREKCRKDGLWQKADEIRKKIKTKGYWVEDTKEGSKIKKL
ncbi:MAG: cysteine--tRNA ligase [Candidatus Nealsonbacteria bacterium RBG_13_42_11]|uniref:Cysteine--tRNA ligase n=1 Tax=Candidatus Nealsonbacteria bacterium RBG_13_42_11 TaxID=1801663 RepID=A0A1G2DZR3_9BACT|nr:MAG: cysteine--tRNA ligase [Candidatus Nealsonbacteria bacterium RBG_13_42_11]